MFDSNLSIAKFRSLPELQGFGEKLFLPMPPVQDFFCGRQSLKSLDRQSPHADLLSGLERILDLRRSGSPVYYPIDEAKDQYLFHFPGKKGAKTIFLVPGGGYAAVCSLWEGFPAAARLQDLGVHAIVINYRSGKRAHFPHPQDDLAAAIRFALQHAEAWGLDPEDYALAGFSAGGHLAASFCTETLGYPQYDLPKPGCAILAYPVVTMGDETHKASRRNLLGKENLGDKALLDRYSVEKQISPAFPKTFLWQCEKDDTVPFENALLLKAALDANGVKNEFRSYPGTAHGWGVAAGQSAEGWLDLALRFWESE